MRSVDDSSPEEAVWQQGYCPICGGWPLLAELRGIELAQYLRCAACGPRLIPCSRNAAWTLDRSAAASSEV